MCGPAIHVPDTRKGLCLTTRGYKPIYIVFFLKKTVSKCESLVVSEVITENNPLRTSNKEDAVLQLQVISRSFGVARNCIL